MHIYGEQEAEFGQVESDNESAEMVLNEKDDHEVRNN